MVLYTENGGTIRKYACTTCIKGHRTSRCEHTNRSLVEIKPKGRPISQCVACRERRRTMHMHVKCSCHRTIGDASTNRDQDPITASPIEPPVQSSPAPSDHHQLREEIPVERSSLSTLSSRNVSSRNDTLTLSSSSPDPLVSRLSHHSGEAAAEARRMLFKVPICDPSDDIDNDTPIFKPDSDRSTPDRKAVLGELYNTSSEELMEKIYKPFTGHAHGPTEDRDWKDAQ